MQFDCAISISRTKFTKFENGGCWTANVKERKITNVNPNKINDKICINNEFVPVTAHDLVMLNEEVGTLYTKIRMVISAGIGMIGLNYLTKTEVIELCYLSKTNGNSIYDIMNTITSDNGGYIHNIDNNDKANDGDNDNNSDDTDSFFDSDDTDSFDSCSE